MLDTGAATEQVARRCATFVGFAYSNTTKCQLTLSKCRSWVSRLVRPDIQFWARSVHAINTNQTA